MAKFQLTINLGNDAMQTGTDVAGALRAVAKRLEDNHGEFIFEDDDHGFCRDVNGNTVGKWTVELGESHD